ncbi:unnamed protein product [Polarella glacialis]|uniref:Uncharacterized protein n=1 Tax=Polarella glacialis TaxID=89957 RepID=A0A813GG28_POLGL|nr:unnamed protein product [Polarella glacialis]
MADQGGTPTKPRKTLRKKGTQAVSPLAEASPKSAKGRGADPSARVKKGSGAKGLKGEAAGTAMMGWNLEDGAKEVAKKAELMANPGLCLSDLVDESMLGGGGAKLSRASKPPSKAKRRTKVNQKQEEDDELAGLGLGLGGEDYGDKEDDGDVEASARLLGSLQQLATEEEQAGEGFERRRSQVQPESEFHAGMNDDEITVEDLLAPMQAAPSFGDMRRQLEGLAKREAMAEPVSEVKKGREERAVQYDATSKDVRKWYPQVHRMQRADQVTLGAEAIEEKSTSGIVSSFTPVDDFERELQEVTRAAGVTEEDVRGAKALPMNPRIREEQQTRQVARLKALMLREQQSSKRVKKIKSKTYRRIHRKNDSKDREVLLERLEHENPELAKQLKQEYEKKHAQNRLLRNRNARKKWTQTMQRFAKGDANAQQEITKQAQKAHDEERSLKRAIRGQDQNDSDSENIDLSGSEDEAGQSASKRTISKAKKLTLDEIRSLDEVGDLPTSGFLGMKFMREAIKTKRESAKQEAQAVLKEIEGMEKAVDKHDDYGDSDDEDKAEDRPGAAQEAAKAKKVNFTEEELAKANKEVDEMLENEDNTTECTVSGPLTVRGVSAAPAGSVLSGSKKGLKGRRSGGLSEIAPETPATPASSSRPASKKIEVENPWLDVSHGDVCDNGFSCSCARCLTGGDRRLAMTLLIGELDADCTTLKPDAPVLEFDAKEDIMLCWLHKSMPNMSAVELLDAETVYVEEIIESLDEPEESTDQSDGGQTDEPLGGDVQELDSQLSLSGTTLGLPWDPIGLDVESSWAPAGLSDSTDAVELCPPEGMRDGDPACWGKLADATAMTPSTPSLSHLQLTTVATNACPAKIAIPERIAAAMTKLSSPPGLFDDVPMKVPLPTDSPVQHTAWDSHLSPNLFPILRASAQHSQESALTSSVPHSRQQHKFYAGTRPKMGVFSDDLRTFVKQQTSNRLSIVSEHKVRRKGNVRYVVQFNGGELSSADGAGFVFCASLPCPSDIRRIVSVFYNRNGYICTRVKSKVERINIKLPQLELGDWLEVFNDFDDQTITFTVYPSAGEWGASSASSATVNYKGMAQMIAQDTLAPKMCSLTCGYLAIALLSEPGDRTEQPAGTEQPELRGYQKPRGVSDADVLGRAIAAARQPPAPEIHEIASSRSNVRPQTHVRICSECANLQCVCDLDTEEAEAEARGEEAEAEDLLGALSMDTQAARDQRELVRTAFVEGTQEDAFEDDIDEADRLKEEKKNPSADLPGWGSWAGEGAPKPREPKGKGKGKGAPAAAVPARAPRGSAQFYEGKAEAAKYFVDKVPYGVQSPEQYDQQLRMPTGPEWNALPMHLQRIKPKIFVKVGTIVPPLMLVKHLPPERREGIMDSWAKSKQPKRLKSRV